jgi:hypothetical protein
MATKIRATGDVVLDVNIDKGGRTTPDSNEAGMGASYRTSKGM